MNDKQERLVELCRLLVAAGEWTINRSSLGAYAVEEGYLYPVQTLERFYACTKYSQSTDKYEFFDTELNLRIDDEARHYELPKISTEDLVRTRAEIFHWWSFENDEVLNNHITQSRTPEIIERITDLSDIGANPQWLPYFDVGIRNIDNIRSYISSGVDPELARSM